MQIKPDRARTLKSPRYIPLRYRFILISSCLLILLLGTIALMLVSEQAKSIRVQLERRAVAMAQSLAATSKISLATYNYIALEQSANQAAQDPDTIYVIVHDKEGRVAGYSGRADLQGKLLQDPVSLRALSATEPLIQQCAKEQDRSALLDVAVPVFIPGSDYAWGTVRVALSLEPVYHQIRRIQWIISASGILALLIGILLSTWAAGRITRPLGSLVQATVEAAHGNFPKDIEVKTGDEVEVLASNFSAMIREIVSQRQKLEMQLIEIKHLQRYTEQLLTTMSDGLLSADKEGNVAAINPAACSMLEISEEWKTGLQISDLLREYPDLLQYAIDALKGAREANQREVHIKREGEGRVILANCSRLPDSDGSIREVIINLHDITELKQLEARMRHSERLAALGTLAAGMAHEIRNPLSAIKTFVQLLPRKVEKPEFLEKFQRTVPRELNRINRLIEDLLELARDPRYRFEPIDIRPILNDALDLFEEELRSMDIGTFIEFSPQLPLVWADADQIIKAFHNLIRNAIQAMPSGGRLMIRGVRLDAVLSEKKVFPDQSGWVSLTFQDTGIGIPPETQKDIFNPFFTTKDTGTGLGLAITHKVITEHGGQIEVNSRIGSGTSFILSLPAV